MFPLSDGHHVIYCDLCARDRVEGCDGLGISGILYGNLEYGAWAPSQGQLPEQDICPVDDTVLFEHLQYEQQNLGRRVLVGSPPQTSARCRLSLSGTNGNSFRECDPGRSIIAVSQGFDRL